MTRRSLHAWLVSLLLALAGGVLGPAPASAGEIGPDTIGAKIASAPAVAEFPWGAIAVVRTEDNRIFFSKYSEGQLKSAGWAEVPGGGRTPYAPALIKTDHNNLIYAAVVGTGGYGMWLQRYQPPITTFEGGSWSGSWQYVPGDFIAGPELVAQGDLLTLLGPGLNGKVHYRHWSVSQNTPLASYWTAIDGFATSVEVAARWIAPVPEIPWNQLVLVGRGNDRRLYEARGTPPLAGGPLQFSGWTEIPGGGLTDHAPALDPFDGLPGNDGYFDGVHVLVRGIADGLGYQTLLNNTWSNGWTYAPPASTNYAPEISGGYNTAALYATGKDAGLYFQLMNPKLENGVRNFRVLVPSGGWNLVPGSKYVNAPPPPPPTPTPAPPTPTPAPTKPDLAWVSQPTFNAQTKQFTLNFKNAGNANAGAFRVGINVNNTNVDDLVYNALAAGQSISGTYDVSVLPPGDYSFNFVLDSYNTVSETNEANNAKFGYFTVYP